ncbi:MAG: VirB4 family type IV secretion system protein, partial [Vicinamibacteraceae bacterium]
MIALRRFFRDYAEAGAFNTLVNLYGYLDEHLFMTKSGAIGAVFALRGVDYECLEPQERARVRDRWETAARVFDERHHLYQYLLKRGGPSLHPTHATHPAAQEALQERRTWFNAQRDNLSDIQLYAVVVYDPPQHITLTRTRDVLRSPLATLHTWFSERGTHTMLASALTQAEVTLRRKLDTWQAQLADTVAPRLLGQDESFALFRTLLNYNPSKHHTRCHYPVHLDYFLADSTLECHRDHLRLDDAYVRVLVLKDPPPRTCAHLLQPVYEIGAVQEDAGEDVSDLILCSEWRPERGDHTRRALRAKQVHFHNTKVSLASYLTREQPAEHEILLDDSATATVHALGEAMTRLEVDTQRFGHFALSVIVHDTDRSRLNRTVAKTLKAFALANATLIDETYNLLTAWLATLPGGHPYQLRSLRLLETNFADLSFIFTLHTGDPLNAHLQREYLTVFETQHKSLYYWNPHYRDVGHTFLLGATGAGKSTLTRYILSHAQKYDPITCIFDIGGEYRALTERFDGAYLHLTLDRQDCTINPFALAPTKDNLDFLAQFIRVLVTRDLTDREHNELLQCVQNLYEFDPPTRRLGTLVRMLPLSFEEPLRRWIHPGLYADLFDNATDTLTFSRWQAFDFEGLEQYPQVLEALLYYVLHRASSAITTDANLATFKLFVVDEAWRFLRDPHVKGYIRAALKTWRKKNAAVLLSTQSTDDLAQVEMLRVVLESCHTKLFLANPNLDPTTYAQLFHLNRTEIELVQKLIFPEQFLL